jgi:RNA polymerase sigma factor (sigma-70 family)
MQIVRSLETLAADSSTLQAYLRTIAGFPRLSVEQQRDCSRRIKQLGDDDALRVLVESSLRLVVGYSSRYRGVGVPLLQLIQEGNLGLIEAARRYEPESRVPFAAFALWWMRQAIMQALTRDGTGGSSEPERPQIAALRAAIEHAQRAMSAPDGEISVDDARAIDLGDVRRAVSAPLSSRDAGSQSVERLRRLTALRSHLN